MLAQSIGAGVGRIVVETYGDDASFTELSYAYPLKLLSPRLSRPKVAVVYVLSYGGGLVGGDQIQLEAVVEKDAILVILSQGSTKVFKTRPSLPIVQGQNSNITPSDITRQKLTVSVPHNGTLLLLPEPVTCFRSAKYDQIQTIHLSSSASLVLLDWYTSGRKSIGEEWVFDRYYSLNEVFVDEHRIARDATLLEEPSETPKGLPKCALADKMVPYSCYASVLLYGPLTDLSREQLFAAYQSITVFKQAARPNVLWSYSLLCEGKGAIVRVAATETEDVKKWLRAALMGLETVLGVDLYRTALG